MLNDWLLEKVRRGEIVAAEWTASINAIAPFDFEIVPSVGSTSRRIDAKSTSGAFSNPVHLSRAELREAVLGGLPYDIYRIYRLDERGAEMRIAKDVGPSLEETYSRINSIPLGVTVDSISIDPLILPFAEAAVFLGNPGFDDPDLFD